MKKSFFLLFALIVILPLSAEQMPAGYYDAINGKKGSALKTALFNIISGGDRYDYGPQKNGKNATWTAFPITDIESDGTIWDMYSNNKRYPPLNGLSAAGMDIEHMLPNSWWGGESGSKEAYKDLYILSPADHQANMNKSNYPPGQLADSNKVNNGVFFMGQDATWGGLAFDVIDEYKGDFARAFFYTATAYENVSWPYSTYSDYIRNSYLLFTDHLINVLLDWHRKDPVSEKEVNRLDAVSSIQHNRNPFIEYPELVEYIWGNKNNTKVNLSQLTRTTDGNYEFPVSPTNPLAHEATELTQSGFRANWSNTGSANYSLDVFTRQVTGANDTLFAMWIMNGDAISKHTDTLTFHKEDGTQITSTSGGLTDGAAAIIMGTKDEQRYYLIKNIDFSQKSAELIIKCSISRNDALPQQMSVYANNSLIKTVTLSANDTFPRFTIPKNTTQIKIASVKGHRISVHRMFIVRGNQKVTETSLSGFPKTVTGLSYLVEMPLSNGDELYYRVTPNGLRASNTIKVRYESSPGTDVEDISNQQSDISTQKILRNGQLYILRNGEIYNVQGVKVE